ncbi:hypothetical protein ACVWZX_002123 [Deinococcus sp. UYEF24]
MQKRGETPEREGRVNRFGDEGDFHVLNAA